MRNLIWLVGLPPLMLTLGLTWVAASELGGRHPLSPGAPRSVAEAAVTGNLSEAARRLESGEAADEIQTIRAGFFPGARVVLATPLEASVIARDFPMLRFLESHTRTVEAARPGLACLAADTGAPPAMISHLDPGHAAGCERGHALAAVFARP